MSENVKKFIDSIGAVAEANFAFYQQMIKAGFSSEQAFELTKVLVSSTLATMVKPNED